MLSGNSCSIFPAIVLRSNRIVCKLPIITRYVYSSFEKHLSSDCELCASQGPVKILLCSKTVAAFALAFSNRWQIIVFFVALVTKDLLVFCSFVSLNFFRSYVVGWFCVLSFMMNYGIVGIVSATRCV